MGEVAAIVTAAAHGDRDAWDTLVERFAGLVWSVARAHRLSPADAADVVQTTWLRCVEHLDRVSDPDRIAAWLATTARRESLRVLRRGGRQVLVDDEEAFDRVADGPQDAPDVRVLTGERDRSLWAALGELPERCQLLLRLLMAEPPAPYDVVSATLQMPIGSIGPTRARCLQRLRTLVEGRGITAPAPGSG